MGNVITSFVYPGTVTRLGSAIDLDTIEVHGVLTKSNGGTEADTVSGAQAQLQIQAFSVELSALAALATTGLVTRTATGQLTTRSLSAGTGVNITNVAGLTANPIISIGQNVATSASPSFSGIENTGAERVSYNTYLSATTLTYADNIVYLSGTFTLQLPPISGFDEVIFVLKNIDVGTVTLSGYHAQTIDGVNTISLSSQYDSLKVQGVGELSAWFLI